MATYAPSSWLKVIDVWQGAKYHFAFLAVIYSVINSVTHIKFIHISSIKSHFCYIAKINGKNVWVMKKTLEPVR